MAGQGLFPFQGSRPVECRATARFFASSRRVVRPNFVDGAGLPYPPKTLPSHRRRARFTCTPHARQLSPYRPSSPRLKRDTDSPKIRLARSQSAQRQRLGGSPPEGPRNPPPTAISISDRPRVDFDWVTAPSDDNTEPHALLSARDHRTLPLVSVAAPSRLGCPRRMSVHGWTIRSNRAHRHPRHPNRTAAQPRLVDERELRALGSCDRPRAASW